MLYRKMTPEDWRIGTTYFVVHPGSGKQVHGEYGPYGPREHYRILDIQLGPPEGVVKASEMYFDIAVLNLNVVKQAAIDLDAVVAEIKAFPKKQAYGFVSNNDVCGWAVLIHKVERLGLIPGLAFMEWSLDRNDTDKIKEWIEAGYRDCGWFPTEPGDDEPARRIFKAEAYVLIDEPVQLNLFNMIT